MAFGARCRFGAVEDVVQSVQDVDQRLGQVVQPLVPPAQPARRHHDADAAAIHVHHPGVAHRVAHGPPSQRGWLLVGLPRHQGFLAPPATLIRVRLAMHPTLSAIAIVQRGQQHLSPKRPLNPATGGPTTPAPTRQPHASARGYGPEVPETRGSVVVAPRAVSASSTLSRSASTWRTPATSIKPITTCEGTTISRCPVFRNSWFVRTTT